MTGGNQLKLSAFITGTPFGAGIADASERGAVVGGTSAGASILAEHMIAFGSGGATPRQRMRSAIRTSLRRPNGSRRLDPIGQESRSG